MARLRHRGTAHCFDIVDDRWIGGLLAVIAIFVLLTTCTGG